MILFLWIILWYTKKKKSLSLPSIVCSVSFIVLFYFLSTEKKKSKKETKKKTVDTRKRYEKNNRLLIESWTVTAKSVFILKCPRERRKPFGSSEVDRFRLYSIIPYWIKKKMWKKKKKIRTKKKLVWCNDKKKTLEWKLNKHPLSE